VTPVTATWERRHAARARPQADILVAMRAWRLLGPAVIVVGAGACGSLEGGLDSTTTQSTPDGGDAATEAGGQGGGTLPAPPCVGAILDDAFDRAASNVQGPWDTAVQSTTTTSTISIDGTDGAAAAPSLLVDVRSGAGSEDFTGRGTYVMKTFLSAVHQMTLRFAIRYDTFTSNPYHLTIAEIDTGGLLDIVLAIKPEGTIYAAEQEVGGAYTQFTSDVSLPPQKWTRVVLTFDATARTATLEVGGVKPSTEALSLAHGGVTTLRLGGVFADYSASARFGLDDVCVF
jgi:hypothetical protein